LSIAPLHPDFLPTAKIIAIDIRPPSQRHVLKSNADTSPELRDRVKRCIEAFFQHRNGGNSLAQILHEQGALLAGVSG